MATVELDGVVKRYGSMPVIHGVDVEIADGEFAVLVGPSGCGKSTLLRMIAGIESIDGGRLLIGSRVVNDVAPKDRDIAMVFQNYALYPHMTVAQNMGFSLKLRGTRPEEITAKVDQAARILGLSELLERQPRQLSGGQRQRVAMGRAIVRAPSVFLFDEPLSNLDAKLRVLMRAEIKALHQQFRTTTVYVTHDQVEAMTLADRIVVMNGGRVEQVGSPLELYDAPANLFVAQFIGSPAMNILEGRVAAGQLVTAEGIELPLAQPVRAAEGTEISYGIRPEHLEIAPAGWQMTVRVLETTGAETHVFGTVGGQPVVAVVRDRLSVAPGESVTVTPARGREHLFDRTTRQRLANAE